MGHRQFGYAQHKLSQIKRIYTDFSLIYLWKSVKSVLSVFYSALFRQAPSGEICSITENRVLNGGLVSSDY